MLSVSVYRSVQVDSTIGSLTVKACIRSVFIRHNLPLRLIHCFVVRYYVAWVFLDGGVVETCYIREYRESHSALVDLCAGHLHGPI